MDDPEGDESATSSRRHSVCVTSFPTMGDPNRHTTSSDFENKFVCGEIMSYDDLKELGSEAAVKAGGKVRQQGKPYESPSFCFDFFTVALLTHGSPQWSTGTSPTGNPAHRE